MLPRRQNPLPRRHAPGAVPEHRRRPEEQFEALLLRPAEGYISCLVWVIMDPAHDGRTVRGDIGDKRIPDSARQRSEVHPPDLLRPPKGALHWIVADDHGSSSGN